MIETFGLGHFVYMGLAVAILATMIVKRKEVRAHADSVGKGILITSILQQILLYSWYYFETGFNLSEALPFHISRVTTILGIIFLMTKNKKILNVAFYWSIYAYGSFLYPADIHPPFHALGISYFTNHVITILLPFFMTIAYGWRPKLEGIKSAYGWFLMYMIAAYFFNPLVDGNYFYLENRIIFQNWPDIAYLIFCGLLTLFLFIFYYYFYKFVTNKFSKTNNISNQNTVNNHS